MKITEDWLKEVGFKWHQVDGQSNKMWTLWLGSCLECPADGQPDEQRWRFSGDDDFGIELTHNSGGASPDQDFWLCWFRSDAAGRYHRFIHVRHLREQSEVIALVEAISGRPWHPERHWYGSLRCQRHSEALGLESRRMDIIRRESFRWYAAEKDDTRSRALPEHLNEAIKSGRAK